MLLCWPIKNDQALKKRGCLKEPVLEGVLMISLDLLVLDVEEVAEGVALSSSVGCGPVASKVHLSEG